MLSARVGRLLACSTIRYPTPAPGRVHAGCPVGLLNVRNGSQAGGLLSIRLHDESGAQDGKGTGAETSLKLFPQIGFVTESK